MGLFVSSTKLTIMKIFEIIDSFKVTSMNFLEFQNKLEDCFSNGLFEKQKFSILTEELVFKANEFEFNNNKYEKIHIKILEYAYFSENIQSFRFRTLSFFDDEEDSLNNKINSFLEIILRRENQECILYDKYINYLKEYIFNNIVGIFSVIYIQLQSFNLDPLLQIELNKLYKNVFSNENTENFFEKRVMIYLKDKNIQSVVSYEENIKNFKNLKYILDYKKLINEFLKFIRFKF